MLNDQDKNKEEYLDEETEKKVAKALEDLKNGDFITVTSKKELNDLLEAL